MNVRFLCYACVLVLLSIAATTRAEVRTFSEARNLRGLWPRIEGDSNVNTKNNRTTECKLLTETPRMDGNDVVIPCSLKVRENWPDHTTFEGAHLLRISLGLRQGERLVRIVDAREGISYHEPAKPKQLRDFAVDTTGTNWSNVVFTADTSDGDDSGRIGFGGVLTFQYEVEGAATVPADPAEQLRQRVAARWAPVHVQDVDRTGDNGLGGKSDYLSAINFDGDWNTRNNWENAPHFPLLAHVYYSVVESSTHWFIVYAFYHPRDWSDNMFGDEHENDLEGLLIFVKKPEGAGDPELGTLQAAVTVAHTDFYSYVPSGSTWTANHESIDGTLRTEDVGGIARPVTAQQANGHGLKAWPYYDIRGGDGVKYYPGDNAEEPADPNDRQVSYKLVDMFAAGGLWERRGNSETFARFGVFAGDTHSSDRANAPWRWDDSNDGDELQGGELAVDPIKVAKHYFKNLGNFAGEYVLNPYRSR